ncbi:MAG: MarR family transcriptional regulator for hemolysin [Myxococcota bacterium]|jgi:MarR family transcriptional regulator for hemolysin
MNRTPLDTSLAYRIYRLHRLLRRHFLSMADSAGFRLTPEQFFLLDKLHRSDGLTQSELADDALHDRPNLTRMVRDLEGRGLLARRPDPDDGRKKRVHLTRAGADLYTAFHDQVVVPTRGQLFDPMPADSVAHTHAILDQLEASLTR